MIYFFFWRIKGEYPVSITTTTEGTNTFHTSSFVEKVLTSSCSQTNEIQNHLNRSHLLLGIVIMFSIVIIFSITYLWLTYNEKKRRGKTGKMKIHVSNENDSLPIPLDIV